MSRGRAHPEFLELAAAGLDGLLGPAEQTRLVAHLARCDVCRARVVGYEDDRLALRKLRAGTPEPPRDLWARTSAELDRAWRGARPAAHPTTGARRWIPIRSTRGAYAAALAALVILAVVGSGVVPGLVGPGASFVATATPLAVEPGVIAYVSTRDGEVGVYMGRIDSVCPEAFQANCQPIDSDVTKVASFARGFVPQQLSVSPDGRQAAVVGTSATGGAVYAVRFPELAEATPHPTGSAGPLGEPTATPSGTAKPTAPGETVGPTVTVVPSLDGKPEAIIDHVIVVGEPPAYSADGTMLAFSAMPVDGSAGPDIYVWRIEDQAMDRLTHDADSIFASWAGTAVVGSRGKRAEGTGADGTATPESFVLDPATGKERPLARAAWRPIVDPTGRSVIFWDGTLETASEGRLWQERHGGLYLAPWSVFDPTAPAIETPPPTTAPTPTAETTPTATPQPTSATRSPGASAAGSAESAGSPPTEVSTEPPTSTPSARPTATATESKAPAGSPKPSVNPAQPVSLFAERDYDADPIVSWEARWSPDGESFGAWIGNGRSGSRPEAGSLTVGGVDRESGRIDPERYQLKEAPAVRGFALGDHRIAWATLAGSEGKSEVRVLVWTDTGRGLVRTTPGGNDTLPAL